MGLGERAKPSNSSVSTTRIRPLSGPHWPWMLLQALSALRSGPRLQHLVQLHIRTDCGPQGHQLKNPRTVVHVQFARLGFLPLSEWGPTRHQSSWNALRERQVFSSSAGSGTGYSRYMQHTALVHT